MGWYGVDAASHPPRQVVSFRHMADLNQRYVRQTILPEIGKEGQARLASARVLCVGAGGLGCPALLYLAAAGVGHITVIDPDVVDETNLQRQILFKMADVGQSKALTAQKHLAALNPDITLKAIQDKLRKPNVLELFEQHDLIIDGTDNFLAKYLINDAAVKIGKPVVFGAIQGFEGQASVFNARGGPCYRCLYPISPTAPIRSCAEAGVIGAVAGIVGTMQAMQALSLIIGGDELKPLIGKFWTIHTKTMDVSVFLISKNLKCRTCSLPSSDIILPDDHNAMCCTKYPIETDILDDTSMLIDVREADAFCLGHLPHAVHFPLSRMELGEWPEIPRHQHITLYCQKGIRSLRAAELMSAQGFTDVKSLKGGYDVWTFKSGK